MFYAPDETLADLGSPAEKFRNNLAALRLLRQLQAEARPATPDEQRVLMRYVGWGDMAVLRQGLGSRQRLAGELAELLSEAEARRLLGSALNAHYTALPIVRAMWAGVARLFGGQPARPLRVLEPSAGIGHFIGAMPEAFRSADVTAVELDSVTAGILRALHPQARVFGMGLEDAPLPERAFDVAISNIPFGNYAVADPAIREKFLRRSIHNYFFVKALRLVRPGGLVAFITSRFTLDAENKAVRAWIAARADLLAAVRLPEETFQTNAGTSVVTDVLFLRVRPEGAEPAGIPADLWESLDEVRLQRPGDYRFVDVRVNRVYVERPEQVIGRADYTGRTARGGPSYTVHLQEPVEEIAARLREQLDAQLPEGLLAEAGQDGRVFAMPALPDAAAGQGDEADSDPDFGAEFAGSVAGRMDGHMEALRLLYATAKTVIHAELRGLPDEAVEQARAALNRAYSDYVAVYGSLHDRRTARALKGHPALPFLLALEEPLEKGGYGRAAIFHRRTVRPQPVAVAPQTPHDALALSLNRFGRVDLAWMAGALGMTPDQTLRALKGSVFIDPETQACVTDDEYLSGNVRAKLKAARGAALFDPRFEENVAALEAVQPPPLRAGEIAARLGAAWIPVEIVRDFIREILPDISFGLERLEIAASWSLEANEWQASRSVAANEVWGTARANAFVLIEDALNGRHTVIWDEDRDGRRTRNDQETVAAQAKQAALRARFEEWVWADPARADELERIYNDRFNAFRARRYNGSHLTLPGLNTAFEPWPHQKDAVWRVVQSRAALLGHEVGFGKTAIVTMAAAELLRLGLARKCLLVVPNHLVGQWQAEVTRLYPALRVLCAGEKDLSAAQRGEFLSRVATGDHQIVIVAHSQFKMLPVRPETNVAHLRREIAALDEIIDALQAENARSLSLKDAERMRKRLQARLQEMEAIRRDSRETVTFEELGIDFLGVDEAHLFKNLWFATQRTRVAGLPNSHSQRAWDMLIKAHWMLEQGRRVVFATATPVANTMAEVYTMMRYLQPDLLDSLGMAHFDAWAHTFGEDVSSVEMTPDGSGFRVNTRFARWVNLPELAMLWRQVLDVRRSDSVRLGGPALHGNRPLAVVLPMSRRLKRFVARLVERAEKIRAGKVSPHEDNMLAVTSDGRKAVLDLRLVENGPEEPLSRINALASNVHAIWQASEARRGAQLIFCDLGTPKARADDAPDPGGGEEGAEVETREEHSLNNRVYHAIRDKLVKLGVPAQEIAFIHDARTRAARQDLFAAVNAGRVRVLIGSTEKMGTGMNAQKRLIALHHLDAPWRPDQLQQREGRILRPGNEYPEVFVFTYQIEGSFDAYIWQTLHSKIEYISQIMAGEVTARTAEDVSEVVLTYADLKALASGNPLVRRRVMIESELARLGRVRRVWEDSRDRLRDDLRHLPEAISRAQATAALFERAIAARDAAAAQPFSLTLRTQAEGGTFTTREEAGRKLMLLGERAALLLRQSAQASLSQKIGEYAGFDLAIRMSRFDLQDRRLALMLGDEVVSDEARISDTPLGTIASLDYQLRGLSQRLNAARESARRLERQLADTRAQLALPWEHQAQQDALEAELRQIMRDLETGRTAAVSADQSVSEAGAADEGEYAPPSAAVLASMSAVRQAIERIREMHAQMALTPPAAGEAPAAEAPAAEAPALEMLARAVERLEAEVEEKTAQLVFGQMVLSRTQRERVGAKPGRSRRNRPPQDGQLTFGW